MHRPLLGVRVLEVAQYAFVPSATAVLADWGADVIKIEHAQRGDAQRGLTQVMGVDVFQKGSSFSPAVDGPNRGKRSIGLALDTPEARPVLENLVKWADVVVTNYLPGPRRRLGVDLEDIRAINPKAIYVRGSGFGQRGPEADKPGYDMTTFWARGGSADGATPSTADHLVQQPAAAYGDCLGGMSMAGGIAAALFARATTGEPSVVDVSLIGVGAWAANFSINLALQNGGPLPTSYTDKRTAGKNPLVGSYRTSDGRWIILSMLQPGKFWTEFCLLAGRTDLAEDPRFATAEDIYRNSAIASELVAEMIAACSLADWKVRLVSCTGAWSVVQDAWDAGQDVSLRENGYIRPVVDAEGQQQELVANPVQFDQTPVDLQRGPLFAEHTDDVVREMGFSDEQLIQLKIAGAIT